MYNFLLFIFNFQHISTTLADFMSKMKTFSEIINEINKEKIGFGGFGDVYKFEYDGKIYALKVSLAKLAPEELNEYEKEAKFLSKFNNEYIVKYYDSFTKDNKLINFIL